MPPRIDSPSVQGMYFSAEHTAPVAPTAAPPHPAVRSPTSPHVNRSGGPNLQRFFASMNCFAGQPLSLDVTTEEGRANYKLAVRAWAARPASYVQESRDRKEIADRIDRWLETDDPSATLDLSNSNLSSLPPLPSTLQSLNANNAFGPYGPKKYPETWPAGLRELHIANNKLKTLPDNLPDTLTTLNAANNGLKRLPKLPRSLEMLNVPNNQLYALPDLPPGLLGLDVGSNKLTKVPEPLPGTLTKLYLSNNPLQVLPQLPDGLTHLYLSGLRLNGLPPLPTGLVELSVRDNHLQQFNGALPSGLRVLDAGNNPPLMALPTLPDTLQVLDIHRARVSELPAILPAGLSYLNICDSHVTQASGGLLQALGRPGPRMMFFATGTPLAPLAAEHAHQGIVNRYGVGMASASLSHAVEAWYGAPDAGRSEAWDRIHQDSQDGLANATVPLWKILDSLKGTEDYPSEAFDTPQTKEARSEMRTALKQRVTNLLDAMASDPDLRKTCLEIAHDRVESCHDNIALGFDEMEQAHQAARAAKGEFPQDVLFNMGIGRLKMALLDELAIPKGNAVALQVAAETGYRPDQVLETVEVVLAYRLGLAERLDLPTKTKHMRYSATARVTEQDLLEAEAKVKEVIADDKRVVSFMVGWRPWQAELERRHPEEFSAQAVTNAKARLRSVYDVEQESYETFCREEGEFSENALNSLEKINRIGEKFNTVEKDTFEEARERLTKAYMGMS